MEQRYRLTYPEKNAVWYSSVPDRCTFERKKECCNVMSYRPKPGSSCSSTFLPTDRPSPSECLKACKGLDGFSLPACSYEKLKYPRIINDSGCLMERSIWQYTNPPLGQLKNKSSILTDPDRIAPNAPEYGFKNFDAYDSIQYVYGSPYTY